MKRVILIILGTLLLLLGLSCAAAGTIAVVTVGSDGAFSTNVGKVNGPGYALLFNKFTVDTAGNADTVERFADLTAGATSNTGQEVFIGIGPSAAVNSYLTGVPRDVVSDITKDSVKAAPIPGTITPAPPSAQTFWIAKAQGTSPTIPIGTANDTTLVIMNAAPSAPVSVELNVGVQSGIIFPVAIALIVLGMIFILLAVWCYIGASRARKRKLQQLAPGAYPSVVPGSPYQDEPAGHEATYATQPPTSAYEPQAPVPPPPPAPPSSAPPPRPSAGGDGPPPAPQQ